MLIPCSGMIGDNQREGGTGRSCHAAPRSVLAKHVDSEAET